MPPAEPRAQRRLAAILAADVVGFSALMGRDEEGTLARIKSLRRDLIEPKVSEHHGRVFKTTGDGFLVEFSSPVEAVRCAIGVQEALARDAAQGTFEGLQLRIGINLGDIIVEGDGDVYGDGVNLAARLEQLAEPGGVCVSGKIYEEVRDKLPANFEDRGEQQVKNIARPVRVYRLAITGAAPPPPQFSTASKTARRVVLAGLAVLAAGAIFASITVWWSRSGLDDGSARSGPSIVVMPIQAPDEQSRTRLLADGLTDDLIGELTRFSGLRVLGRNTSNSFAKSSADVQSLSRDHGVNYVVRATLNADGDKISLRAELVDAASGLARWSERFEGEVGGPLQALDAVVARIAGTVAVRVNRSELDASRRKTPVDLTAYELTLRGRQLWQRPNRDALLQARALFLKAAETDPNYAPPLAYAAFTHLTAFNNSWSDEFAQPAALQQMLQLADRALGIDPSFAAAYAAQAVAYTYLGRHDEAEAAAGRALASNPNDTDVLGRIGQVQSFSGKHREALATLNRAIGLDPFGPAQWFNFLSRAHFFLQEDAAAITAARTCLDRSKIQPCQETLVAALALSGQIEAAAQGWKDLTAQTPQTLPETLVARIRPAFRKASDLDRLVEGLRTAAQHASPN